MLKQDPALIAPGYYQELTNLLSPVEGNLSVRLGNQQLTVFNPDSGVLHSIARLIADYTGSPTTTRYVGQGQYLFDSTSALSFGSPLTFSLLTNPIADPAALLENQRFQTVDVAINSLGTTYKFFACQLEMLKSNGQIGSYSQWGIHSAVIPATATLSGSSGGPPAFTGAEVPYTYVYTYRNSATLSEGNPSPTPLITGVTPNGNIIVVTGFGWVDTQIDQIGIYRAGGSFSDGFYRLLAYIPNPYPSTITFNDTYSDQEIAANQIVETDNDMPVTSSLPIVFKGTGGTGTYSPGSHSFIPTIITNTPGFWPAFGDPIIVTDGADNANPELCYMLDVASPNISLHFQLTHTAPLTFTCDTHLNTPATIALYAYDAVFLAGAQYSPHILYKAKPAQPESWGLLDNDTDVSDAIVVSNPGDPIKGLFDYGGGIVIPTLQSVYYVGVFNGIMQTPQKTPAQHGCVSKACCCRVSNEVWYVSFDGIYAYSGGVEIWKSEEVDPLFNGSVVGNYNPILFTTGAVGAGVDAMTLAFNGTDVVFSYQDINGGAYSLRYNLKLKRWSIEEFTQSTPASLITAQNVEFNSGSRLIGVMYPGSPSAPTLLLADSGLSDNWLTTPTSGTPILWAANMQTLDSAPDTDKLYSDFALELANDNNAVYIETYYNFSTNYDTTDLFIISQPGSPIGRIRYPFSFHNSAGFLAYAASLRISGSSGNTCTLYSLTLHYSDEVNYTKGLAYAYSDLGYQGDKTFRNVILEMDTGGLAVEVFLDVDGNEIDLGPVTTTTADRKRIVSVPTNITGKMARVRLVPSTGAKTNVYKVEWDYAKEPLATNFFDSLEYTFGYNGYSFQKQAWFQYYSADQITVQFYSDDEEFHSVTLPAHASDSRLVERFYFPQENGGVLNKAKTHRFEISSSGPFRLYKETSRIEWLPLGADQRSGYQQLPLSQIMQPVPA